MCSLSFPQEFIYIFPKSIPGENTQEKVKAPNTTISLPDRRFFFGDPADIQRMMVSGICVPIQQEWRRRLTSSIYLRCGATEFECGTPGQCISNEYVCDGKNDCADGADEKKCGKSSLETIESATMCSGKNVFFHNSLQHLPLAYIAVRKRLSKLSKQ